MFKAIVFDLDGTLIDSPLCFKTIRQKLEIPEGHAILEAIDSLPPHLRNEKLRALEEIELEAAQGAVAYEGVENTLAELRRRQILIGILTRNCRSVALRVVKTLNLPVDEIVAREDAPPKPDPAGLELLSSRWGLGAQDLLFVGDFRYDIECGRNAGVRTALFIQGRDPETPGAEWKSWKPDHVFRSFEDFVPRFIADPV